jgi:phage gp46-like protein
VTALNERWQSPKINTKTHDFEFEDGDLVMDDTPHSDIAFALGTVRGSIPVNPDFGNKVFTIRKLTGVVPIQAEEYCREVIDKFRDEGVVKDIQIAAEVQGGWLLAWEVAYELDGDERRVVNLTAKEAGP